MAIDWQFAQAIGLVLALGAALSVVVMLVSVARWLSAWANDRVDESKRNRKQHNDWMRCHP